MNRFNLARFYASYFQPVKRKYVKKRRLTTLTSQDRMNLIMNRFMEVL